MLAATWPTRSLSMPWMLYARAFDEERDAFRRRDDDRVRETERQLQVRTLHLRAVADTLHFEGLGEPVGDADHHVAEQRAGEAVKRALVAFVVRAGDVNHAVFAVEDHGWRELADQFTLRALHETRFSSPTVRVTLAGTVTG